MRLRSALEAAVTIAEVYLAESRSLSFGGCEATLTEQERNDSINLPN